MDNNIINTIDEGERVTSTYAEIYFDDKNCDLKNKGLSAKESSNVLNAKLSKSVQQDDESNICTSPSDLLIGIIELKPPFTSKITRGRTHEGILAIGDEIIQAERNKFLKKLACLIHENDAAWTQIMEHEKATVVKKVHNLYSEIFLNKSKTMQKEMTIFYEKSLQELENHIATELSAVLIDAHAGIVSDLNNDIKTKLEKEKEILNAVLKKQYDSEVTKIKKYYKLLLDNEKKRNKQLVNKAIVERNDALKAFYRETEAENITSTMYIMSLERKKCRIKQFLMENDQDLEIKEKMERLKEKQDIVDTLKKREVQIAEINKDWEDKIQKILQIFLKFISFSMKLLPEQATFLLDLEKMVVLQLNEIQKKPYYAQPILIDTDNIFKFDDLEIPKPVCEKPFVVAGDSSATIPPKYGSRETLPDDADLPYVRLQRQYVFAKCHKYEEVKAFLESQRCKCDDILSLNEASQVTISSEAKEPPDENSPLEVESSNELLVIDDFKRIQECPERKCQDWVKRMSFPYLDSYLDFNEENLARVEAILGNPSKSQPSPKFIDPKLIVSEKLPFSETHEPTHTIGTQYSSQEEFELPPCDCPCVSSITKNTQQDIKETNSRKAIDEALLKRKHSIRRLMNENPNLLKIFTDECFDFIM